MKSADKCGRVRYHRPRGNGLIRGVTTYELEVIRGQVQQGLDNVTASRAERLEEYPLARLSGWTPPLRTRQPSPESEGN